MKKNQFKPYGTQLQLVIAQFSKTRKKSNLNIGGGIH